MERKTQLWWILLLLAVGENQGNHDTDKSVPLKFSFRSLVESGARFTDKSLFIPHILAEPQITYISRPRLFGKTFNKDMLATFLRDDLNSSAVFKNLHVGKPEYEDLRNQHMNKHPVIEFNMNTVNEITMPEGNRAINRQITHALMPFQYLKTSTNSTREEIATLTRILGGTATDTEFNEALGLVCKMLKAENKSPIVLIDEADTALTVLFRHGHYKDMESRLFRIFMWLLKSCSSYFEQVIFFGILPLFHTGKLASINMVTHLTIFDPILQADFGLTVDEVNEALKANGLKDLTADEITEKFGGYRICDTMLYNPRGVYEFINRKGAIAYTFDAAGAQTELVRVLLTERGHMPAVNFQRMVRGDSLPKRVTRNFNIGDLYTSELEMWTFFCHTGYLVLETPPPADQVVFHTDVKIANRLTRNWISGVFYKASAKRGLPDYDTFIESLEQHDLQQADEMLTEYLRGAGRYFNQVGRRPLVSSIKNYVALIVGGWSKVADPVATKEGQNFVVTFRMKDSTTQYVVRILMKNTEYEGVSSKII